MATLTPVLGLSKPVVGADDDVWGNMWNGNADILDTLVKPIDLAPYLLKAGGTMTGDIVLKGNAAAALNPVPLQQMNAAIAAIPAGVTQAYVDTADNLRVLKAGDTMTNQLQITAPANASSVGQNLLLNGSISPAIRFHDGTNPAFGFLYYSGSMWLCSFTTPAGTGENDICFFSTSLIEFRKNLSMANNRIRQVGAPLSGDEATNKTYVDGLASTSLPIVNGTAAIGTGTTWARADHIHGSDPTKLNDAPADSAYYARRNNAWAVAPGSAISTDAPSDGTAYGRLSAAWQKVPWFTAKGNVMLGGPPEPATIAPANATGATFRTWIAITDNVASGMYYDNAAVWRRLNAVTAPTVMFNSGGGFAFSGAAAGAADSAVTLNALVNITAKGNLMLGVPEPAAMSTKDAVSGGSVIGWTATFNNFMSFMYYDTAGATFRRLDAASPPGQMSFGTSGFVFEAAATGAKDSAVTLSRAFQIIPVANSGNAGYGIPADLAAASLSSAQGVLSNSWFGLNMYNSVGGWRARYAGCSGMWYADTNSETLTYYSAASVAAGAVAAINNRFSIYPGGVSVPGTLYTGGHSATGTIQTSGLIQSNGGRVISYLAGTSTLTMVNTSSGYAYGFYVDASTLNFAQMGWDGGVAKYLGNFNINGDLSTVGGVVALYFQTANWIYCAGASYAYGGVFCGGNGAQDFGFVREPGNNAFHYATDWRWLWGTSGGQLTWYVSGNPMWGQRTSDWLAWNGTGPVGGIGPYNNYSDLRGKRDIEPSSVGLPEILKLNPVKFIRVYRQDALTGRVFPDGRPMPDFVPRPEIGFVAQEVLEALPDAVVEVEDFTGEGTGAGFALTYDTITAALVNAVKTLNARLAALEAIQ